MIHFAVTSENFSGDIIYKFNGAGAITCIDIQAEVDEVQRKWLLEHIPPTVASLENMVKKAKALKMEEVMPDLSFATFWNKYDYRVGDKKKAEKLWNALSEVDKNRAINNIPKYNKYLQAKGYDKIYPERYLSKGYYSSDFKI